MMKKIDTDWHIHTHNSCDGACMEFDTFLSDAKKLGIIDFGVTDHLHSLIQEPDIAASRREYDIALEQHPELKGHFHFGIEVSIMSEWELDKINRGDYLQPPIYGFRSGGPQNSPAKLAISEDFLEKYKIEYVVTGMHWPLYCEGTREALIREYHRQYMFAATHPLTDIMAHYLWWDSTQKWENPFLSLSVVPASMRDELQAALIEHQVAFEVNLSAVIFSSRLPNTFKDEYLGWAADLQRSGVVLAIGSDCHSPSLSAMRDQNGLYYEQIGKLMEHYKIDTDALFRL